ncbi:hypothetical protein PT276_04840 [Orbaceae bacterium ESL0721]|nr:hypothetical protein [Orbaceae bacterium ESL0721]
MRVIYLGLLTVFMLLLSGCGLSQHKINKEFEKGNYQSGINLLTEYMSKQKQPLSDKDAQYLIAKVNEITLKAETDLAYATTTDYEKNIESYKLLMSIRKQLANKPYGKLLVTFNQRYPETALNQQLVTQYYNYAKSQKPSTSTDYQNVVNLYKEGMSYDAKYKDIAKQYDNNLKQYYKVAAKEYYDAGKEFASQQNYKAASESFAAAEEVYKPLGHYKDSAALSKQYDKKYRSIEADNYIAKAKMLLNQNTTSRINYRTIAYFYQQAADIYEPHGDYKNAAKLAAEYRDSGCIKIYIANSNFSDMIQNELSDYYYDFVNYASYADVTINISLDRPDYNSDEGSEQIENKSEQIVIGHKEVINADGTVTSVPEYKEYNYTVHSRTKSNSLKLQATIEASGELSESYTASGSASSSETHYRITGNAPANKKAPHTSGQLLSRDELYERAYDHVLRDLKSDLTRIRHSLEIL